MQWFKKKKKKKETSRAYDIKQRPIRGHERGAILLEELIECCNGKSNPIKIFSANEITKATDNICKCPSPQRRPFLCKCTHVSELSEYGRWYSGKLDNHRMILIKKVRGGHIDYPRHFHCGARDIAISSMVSGHKNFMKLVGCCLEFRFPMMIYYGAKKQYSPLDLDKVFSWEGRTKIAMDIASALTYLHTAFPRPFVYANMNLWNILLDQEGVAKLSDFSRCVLIPQGKTFVKQDSGGGDYHYMDDDYLINGVVSEKTDAFSFGIFMQKLLTGEERFREVYGWNPSDLKTLEKTFPKWLSITMAEGKLNEIVDPKMLEEMSEVSKEERCRVEAFLVLSERCIGLRGEVPKMLEVAKELKRILKNVSFSSETGIDLSCVFLPN